MRRKASRSSWRPPGEPMKTRYWASWRGIRDVSGEQFFVNIFQVVTVQVASLIKFGHSRAQRHVGGKLDARRTLRSVLNRAGSTITREGRCTQYRPPVSLGNGHRR